MLERAIFEDEVLRAIAFDRRSKRGLGLAVVFAVVWQGVVLMREGEASELQAGDVFARLRVALENEPAFGHTGTRVD